MRHGAMMDSKNTVIQDRFPKMNLLENETFEDQLKVLDDSITVLENQRLQRLTELDRLKAQRQNYEHELAKLSAEVSNLS
jgi:ABC-type Fe3+/spermidine/putrescine transport system ATPase subunit